MSEEPKKAQECFVIMPFTTPEGYEADHFNKIYEQLFKPAIKMAGYEPHRVDEDIASNTIQSKIIGRLIDAPMVLCDLSTRNPNVLYELGMRHAFEKPVLLVQEVGTQRIFDISGITTVEYRNTRLYDEVVNDQQVISKALKETAEAKKKYSVLSTYGLDAAQIRQTGEMTNDEKISLQLAVLKDAIDNIGERLNHIERSERKEVFVNNYLSKYDSFEDANRLMDAIRHAQNIVDQFESNKNIKRIDVIRLQESKESLEKAILMMKNHPIDEPGLEDLLSLANDLLEFMTQIYRKISAKEMTKTK